MRFVVRLAGLLSCVAAPALADERFEAWTAACEQAKGGAHCRVSTEAPVATGGLVRLSVERDAGKDANPRLVFTSGRIESGLERPRLALAVDGGPPLRFGVGADMTAGPGSDPATIELKLSEAATRRLLPFLRRGKALQATVSAEDGDKVAATLPLPGLAAAASSIDKQQGRTDRPDALAGLIGGGSQAAMRGSIRDVAREAVPPALKQTMVSRDCPVWDQTEPDASFLADESFAADLGGGRTLWAIVCTSGSYNVEFGLFVEDPSKAADRFEPLLFAAFVESIGWTGVDTLSNVAYDTEKKQLTAFDKGRAAGDCGQYGTWEWVGAAFRMVEYRAKEECDGVGQPTKFPIVFRGER